MTNLIYALYCPINKVPVYIGKTTKGLDRPFTHIENKSHSIKVKEWVKQLQDEGLSPMVVVLETTDNPMYLDIKEKFWINKTITEGHVLLNQTLIKPITFTTLSYSFNNQYDSKCDIGNFIRLRRMMAKLTQPELAQKAGVGLRVIRELEQCSKTNFSTDTINKILYLFGTKLIVGPVISPH